MQIFLIRHPRPLVGAGVCYGQLDVDCVDPLPLAAQLAARLPAGVPVVSSPLRRARRLALALDANAGVDARLSEISFGAWEGQPWDAIARDDLDAWAADVLHFAPPGGESVDQLRRRAIAFADSLKAPQTVIVTHAGILRALLGYWHNLPLDEWTQLQFDFASLTAVEV